MKTIQISTASRPLAEYAQELKDEILVVNGLDRESLALSAHPEFLDLDRTLACPVLRRSNAYVEGNEESGAAPAKDQGVGAGGAQTAARLTRVTVCRGGGDILSAVKLATR